MKILFLDIDGVVNSHSTTNFKDLYPLDPYMAFLVGRIQLETGCKVVLSSSWRHHPEAMKHVSQRVVELLDKTPRSNNGFRGDEINAWLKEHPEVEKYAILDDDSDFYETQPLFQTTFENGLTDEIAEQVTEYLGRI